MLFVKNCMEQCSSNSMNKMLRKRQVRIVIVFLQNLLKQRIVDFEEISPSIKQFCIEHAPLCVEANALLKEIISQSAHPKESTGK